ncbi:hypothetical protein CR105_22200 [Massilia eurypsychrophila]|jgi:hypothetical protein|uniref:Uncharacterized protein n=1 Tax=Massilia eurypsychrophila TaxID=1485217 RepID=A0A2G8TA28_9BURK|nr:hypothetical protein [Massilia eurypsychrophila]PIL42823.1 hypothetical protein CR105_22200 [Massilia eurypsychrophila]
MQAILMTAGVLAIAIGLVHSVFGEVLIFRHLRKDGFVPSMGAAPLRARHIGILWATWHLATVFGWAFAGAILRLAVAPDAAPGAVIMSAAVFANLAGALLVLVGTRGRHPGWIALSAVAALVWFGAKAP